MIAAGDIGVAPTRRDRFTDFSLSTKIFEYAAMGKPVVATRLPMVEETFPAGTVSTYEPGDSTSLADAIQGLVDDPAERESRIARTLAIVRDAAWERFADRYAAIIEDLAADGRTGTGTIQEATAVMTTGPADATDAPANATVGATVEQV
jgi:glycosyltransferase involved in cell wall biosynthesis